MTGGAVGSTGHVPDVRDVSPIVRAPEITGLIPSLREGVHNVSQNIHETLQQNIKEKPIAPAIILAAILGFVVGSLVSPQIGTFVGLIVAAVLSGDVISAKIGSIATKAIADLTKTSQSKDTSPTTALNKKNFKEALKSGKVPPDFIDKITHELIEDPVGFVGDETHTVYDRKTITHFQESGFVKDGKMKNPLDPSNQLEMDKMVSLPKIKEQIDKFCAKHPQPKDDEF